ncbi:hypothetical protein Barb7_00439 [Bacteroidales bacterium Barb7]|nr:hypothetical protein Barb7_00439 [Bacteroidales bacterium Barb7]
MNDYEFKVFSQSGEDGIIQHLIKSIDIKNETFIEFGIENYMESNTRFLMMNNEWRGFVIDGSSKNIEFLKKQNWFWMYDLQAKDAFIDRDNVNELLKESDFSNIGLLSIDIDGNDYWIFEALDLSLLNPAIIIVEYNALFGIDRAISIPYNKKFNRTKVHYSNLFWGASLSALNYIAQRKGYELVGCCKAGTNAFFVRKDLLNEKVQKVSVEKAFRESFCRQSRDKNYKLSFLRDIERYKAIKGLHVMNIVTNEIETF